MKIIGLKLRKDPHLYQIKQSVDDKITETDLKHFFVCEIEGQQDVGRLVFIKELAQPKLDQMTIVRRLGESDFEAMMLLDSLEEDLYNRCQQEIHKHHLPMKLVAAKLTFDQKKLTFYFTAEGRIDFRDLVKELVVAYRKLIRLEQISQRDAAAMMGGIGPCGQRICCETYLHERGSVTVDCIRHQNLHHLKSNKVSGICGKLMCCLAYELPQYLEQNKGLPEIGEEVQTKEGKGTVVDKNILERKVIVSVNKKNVEVQY